MSDAADEARARLVRQYDAAHERHDVQAMAEAALGLAGHQVWGTVPGRLPAFLYEAYSEAEGPLRARLAVAIARVWAYSGDPARAATFAAEALADAEQRDDPTALAAALDASLLVRWGPDDLSERTRLTQRLDDAVAHVSDVEARMSAYLWRLTTAMETLDRPAALRQVRSLDDLAAETGSPRVVFFAASRRAVQSLVDDDVPAARASAAEAIAAGWDAGEPDAYAIEHALIAAIARHEGDAGTLAAEAALFEAAGMREGITAVLAEAAMLWDAGGVPERAESLLLQVATRGSGGAPFATITRDVEWLLTMAMLTEVAANRGVEALCAAAVELLEPYAGRGVVNGGGAGFAGVVDDYLGHACEVLGRDDDQRRWSATAAGAYARIGAVWWARRTVPRRVAELVSVPPRRFHLRPGSGGIWWVGRDGAAAPVRDSKGLRHLRTLLAHPQSDIAAVDLSDVAVGNSTAVPRQPGLDVVDRTALADYRQRLRDIDAELDEARAWSDPARAEQLSAERDALLAEVRAATGAGGRVRRTGSTDERARVAVRKAIAAAIQRIGEIDPELSRVLADTVRTGATCRYSPDPHREITWILDEPAA
ncbi:MAG: hypothetical protein ACREN2_05915 [Candidatus Dormibacteria bacterium]